MCCLHSINLCFQSIQWCNFIINPLYTNGFFLRVSYNKFGIVHCTYIGLLYFLSEDLFYFYSVDHDLMLH